MSQESTSRERPEATRTIESSAGVLQNAFVQDLRRNRTVQLLALQAF